MRYLLLSVIAVSLACRETPETGARGAASASPYTADADADTSARDDAIEGTNSGTELEAPRLIPALKNQLGLMRRGSAVNEDNLLAYKNLAQDVINSMVADMYRAGYSDTGSFRALKDSVLEEIGGGGGGSGPDLERSEVPRHVQRMERLVDLYQQAMRSAAGRL